MNKYEHAAHSAKIFGGRPEEYEDFHALIDNNKLVTPSIFGRFFLHHIDVGLPILQKIFGETVGKKKVPTKKLLAQHLIEDYGIVLTFENNWMPALKENINLLPKADSWELFLDKAKNDSRIKSLDASALKELDDFMRLRTLLTQHQYLKSDLVFAIFGHALGGDLAAKALGPKIHNLWTSDVVTGYLNCRFKWTDRHRDAVPTLLDYEQHVPDYPWMHAPKEELTTDELLVKINNYEKVAQVKKEIFQPRYKPQERRPCNLD